MRKHFGTKIIKEWIYSEKWKVSFPGFEDLESYEKKERTWQEVCDLFLDYLKNSPSSPYQSVLSIFARFEYQKGE